MRREGLDRRLPRIEELKTLVKLRKRRGSRIDRKLSAALTVDDVRLIAMRRAPRAVFDYVEGGADDEVSLRTARRTFANVEFRPRVLRDVSAPDTSTTILGEPCSAPLVFAPTGFTRMMHAAGESAVARVASRFGFPYSLSTMGTTSIEALAEAVPTSDRWFQLYVWRDRGRTQELVERAKAAGYRALVLTVDVPVPGARLRDVRNGLTIPPTLTLRTLMDMARHPSWWFDALTTAPLQFASLSDSPEALAELVQSMFDPAVTFADVEWLRGIWTGPLVVKGIQRSDDAISVAKAGADGIVVSHHGGRQLDRVRPTLDLLPEVVDAVGDSVEVLLDSGVRSGADIAAAVASGARACLVGRAYLYGLMAAGEPGVDRVATLLTEQFKRSMQLLGASTVSDLTRDLLKQERGDR